MVNLSVDSYIIKGDVENCHDKLSAKLYCKSIIKNMVISFVPKIICTKM